MRTATQTRWIAGMALVSFIAIGMLGSAQSNALSIVLTGQSGVQSDFRTNTPEVVSAMKPLLEADVVFTNLETSVAMPGQNLQNTPGAGPGFNTPPEGLDALMALGVNLISNANNQAWNLGPVGVLNTNRETKKRNLAKAGSGPTLREASAPAYLKTPKGTVALVAMASGAVPVGASAAENRPGVNELRIEANGKQCLGSDPCAGGKPNDGDAQRILQSIQDAKAHADFVIVYQHNHVFPLGYGDIAKAPPERLVPPDWLKEWCHSEVEAGADVVVLHGPPVLLGVEIYRGRPIFYDQGNFIFQAPDTVARNFDEPTGIAWRSTASRIEFEGKTLKSITFRPYVLNKDAKKGGDLYIATRGLPMPATGDTAKRTLEQLKQLSRPLGTEIEVKGETARVVLK